MLLNSTANYSLTYNKCSPNYVCTHKFMPVNMYNHIYVCGYVYVYLCIYVRFYALNRLFLCVYEDHDSSLLIYASLCRELLLAYTRCVSIHTYICTYILAKAQTHTQTQRHLLRTASLGIQRLEYSKRQL